MSTRPIPLTGSWVDYSRGNNVYYLTSDNRAQWMKAIVGIFLGLSTPYVFEICRSLMIQARKAFSGLTEEEREALLSDTVWNNLIDARGGRDAVIRMLRNIDNFSLSRLAKVFLISLTIFFIYGAQALLGAFSTNLPVSSAARSSSMTCGIWEFDYKNADHEAATRSDVYNDRMEASAADYAQRCYATNAPGGCDIFYNSTIGYNKKSFEPCPFENFDLCRAGLHSAVTFDTGLVDANTIGINSKPAPKFRRQTTCSPLNMDPPYISSSLGDLNHTTNWYHYGSTYDEEGSLVKNETYESGGNPFHWPDPTYSLTVYATSLHPEYDYWRPIPALRPPPNSTLTILFITSTHIYYIKPSFDPIFPAKTPDELRGFREPFYINSDHRAQALACVDTTSLCSADGETCWAMSDPTPSNIPDVPSSTYWFLKWSLRNSNVYDSIKWRLGAGLIAQGKIRSSFSQPLSENHWESEAEMMFTTGLARTQFDAWSIAIGEGKDEPGFVETTPKEGRGKLCRI